MGVQVALVAMQLFIAKNMGEKWENPFFTFLYRTTQTLIHAMFYTQTVTNIHLSLWIKKVKEFSNEMSMKYYAYG